MQAPIDIIPQALDLLLHGGNVGVLALAAWVGIKVLNRLNRDESLRRDYPPHRHINGSVVYPAEYEPAKVGHLPIAHDKVN